MRRALRVIAVLLVVVVLLVIAGAQAVLWTDYPRQIVVAELRNELGMHVEIDELRTGWLGRTELRNFRLSLPLDDRPFVEAPAVRVGHVALWWLVLTGDPQLNRMDVDHPVLTIRQRIDGSWNLEEAQRIFDAQIGATGNGAAVTASDIPALNIRGASVVVEPIGRAPFRIDELDVRGEVRTPLHYRATVRGPRVGESTIDFSPGEPWQHEARFALQPTPELLTQVGLTPLAVSASGTYRGSFAGGVLRGQLDLDPAEVEGHRLVGRAAVRFDTATQRLTAEPHRLAVVPAGIDQVLRLGPGRLTYVPGGKAQLERLAISALGIDAALSGELDPEALTGQLRLEWQQDDSPLGITHRGRGMLTLARTAGGPRVTLEGETTGDTPWGTLEADILAAAHGPDWSRLNGNVAARRLAFRRDRGAFTLDGAVAHWALQDRVLRLLRVRLPDEARPRVLAAQGQYDLDENQWSLQAVAAAFLLPGVPFPLDRFTFEARGDVERAEIETVTLRAGGIELDAVGAYVFHEPQPLAMTVRVRQVPIRLGPDDARRIAADNLFGELRVRGSAMPIVLDATGELTARNLRVGGEPLGDIAMQVRAHVDDHAARATAVAPRWLGGRWEFEGLLDRLTDTGRLLLVAEDLDLSRLQFAIDAPVELHGVGGLRLDIDVPRAEPQRFVAVGEVAARDVRLEVPLTWVNVETFRGDLRMDMDRLELTNARAQDGDATVDVEVTAPLAGGPIRLRAQPRQWPLRFDAAEAQTIANGDITATLDPATGAVEAAAQLNTRWRVRDQEVAEFDVDATVTPSRLDLRQLTGNVLTGTVNGAGIMDLQQIESSDLTLTWRGIRPSQLAPFWDRLGEIGGTISGDVRVAHTTDRRAPAPMRMTMNIDATDASVRGVAFERGEALGFSDGTRWVLQSFELGAAGGTLSAWGRVTPQRGEWFAFLSAAATNIDVEPLAAALIPERAPVVGRVSTELTLSLPIHDWRLAFGRGSFEVTDADFGSLPLFGALYDVINLRIGDIEPAGRGRGAIRVEEGVVVVHGFRYQNRGAQINLAVRVHDLWAGEESDISGYAAASQRLLPEVAFFGEVGEALDVLQQDLTPIRVSGTLGSPRLRPDPLRTLGDALGGVVASPTRRPEPIDDEPAIDGEAPSEEEQRRRSPTRMRGHR